MSLLNESAVRKRVLELGKAKGLTRVSPTFIAAVTRRVDELLRFAIHRHPSKGVVIRDFNP